MLTYRILRYVPNLMRDEWMNIGVLLEDGPSGQRAIKLIEEDSEFARVRRLNPAMDDSLLRGLAGTFDAELRKPNEAVAAYLEKLDQTLSNAVQFGPVKGVFAEDFDAELDRLYQDQVAPPARARGGIIESTRAWIKARLNDVFRRRRVPQLARAIRVEEFTQPGDPLRLDYGYRNGVQGTSRPWRSAATRHRPKFWPTRRKGFERACRMWSSPQLRRSSPRGTIRGTSLW